MAALATAGVAALPASACPPALPGLTGSVPKSGETYPANAAVFLFGAQVSLDDVAVTVDGEPASLVPAEKVASLGLSSKAVLVDTGAAAALLAIAGRARRRGARASSRCR